MSGEATGVIGGGILLVAGLPVIMTAVAGTAALAGTAAVVYQVSKKIQKAEQKHREKVDLEKCSIELQEFSAAFYSRAEEMENQNIRFYKKMMESLQVLEHYGSSELEDMSFDSIREAVVSCGRERLFTSIDRIFMDYIQNVEERFQQESRNQEVEIEKYKKVSDRVVQMSAFMEDMERRLQRTADQFWEDARGMMQLLENENKAFGNIKDDYIGVIRRLLDSVEKDYSMCLYEKVIMSCNGVVEKGILLLQDIRKEGSRREFLHNQLAFRYEYLSEWLKHIRYVNMKADENYKHEIHEDLNDFCQGKLQDFEDQILEMRKRLSSIECNSWTDIMYREELELCDKKLIPQIERTISAAYGVLQNYLKKVDIIEVLAEFMEEQGYDVDWSLPKGDDLSQQMVTHFTNPISQSEISIVLDVDSPMEEFSDVTIDILSYEQGESANIEVKREKLRTAMMETLRQQNILLHAPLVCKRGTVNHSSEQTAYNSEEKVMQMNPTIIFP